MKTAEQLGISPAPRTIVVKNGMIFTNCTKETIDRAVEND